MRPPSPRCADVLMRPRYGRRMKTIRQTQLCPKLGENLSAKDRPSPILRPRLDTIRVYGNEERR